MQILKTEGGGYIEAEGKDISNDTEEDEKGSGFEHQAEDVFVNFGPIWTLPNSV